MSFDGAQYEQQLQRGLSLSGEGAEYFSRQRVKYVQQKAAERGLSVGRILEVGCGTGTNLIALRAAFPTAQIVGYEPDDSMRAQASQHVRVAELTGEMPREAFDLVFLNGVIHHVPPEERPTLFGQLRARTAGLLAVFDNNPLNPGAMWVMRRIPFDRDAQPLRARTMVKHARMAGFGRTEVRTYFYFPGPLAALRGLEPSLSRLPLGAQYAVYAQA